MSGLTTPPGVTVEHASVLDSRLGYPERRHVPPWSSTGSPAARPARALLVLPAAGLAACAGLAFSGAFAVSEIAALCLVSAAIPALVAAMSAVPRRGGRRPLPGLLTLAVSAIAWAALLPPAAAALAVPGTASGGSAWHLLAGGLVSAPKQLLTTVPPAPATPVFLLALGTLVWFAAAWSAEAAVRESGPLLPLAGPALVLLAGTAAGIPAGSAAQLWPAAAFVALAVVLIAARRALGRARGRGQGPGLAARAIRLLLSAATVAVVAGLAVGVAAGLPGLASRPPADPRPLVMPPPRSDTLLDPMSLAASWLASPVRPLFTVTTSAPVNLRWLVLDRYDGTGWSSSASYLPAGSRLPAATGVSVPSTLVAASVRITGLPGMWLPAADHPAQVSGIAVRVDPATGTLATDDGSPASGRAYEVVSDLPSPRLADLSTAVPGSGPALAAQLTVPPGLPAVVAGYGPRATAGAAYPYQQMVLLQDSMLRDFRYSPQAAPGESYGHLAFFVSGRRVGGPGAFATLFAILAREAGFPARVVIGFTPGQPTGPGQYQVTTADTLIWPEVYFARLGWTPFYPLPRPGTAASRLAERAVGEPPARSALDQQAARAAPGRGTRSGPPARVSVPPAATSPPGLTALASTLIALCALAALACGYLVAAAAARQVARRRRRRHPDPRQRVAGAWQEALGGIGAAARGTDLRPLSAEEVAREGAALLGPESEQPLGRLATVANAALFAAAPPSEADADAAWADADRVRELAWSHTSWRSRAAVLVRPVRG